MSAKKEGGDKKEESAETKDVGTEKKSGGEEKKEVSYPPSIFKMDMHCEGCAKKIRRTIKNLGGVETVKTDTASHKLTVTGMVDAVEIKAKLEEKTKKKVEIISAPPPPAKKNVEEKKPEEKKPELKAPPPESTVVLKIKLHCEGCIAKIKKIIKKANNVNSVEVDVGKELVTVKGTMNVDDLPAYLTAKLRRSVELVSPNKDAVKKDGKKETAKEDGKKEAAKEDGKKEAAKEDGKKEAAKEDGKKEAAKEDGKKEAAKDEGKKDVVKIDGKKDGGEKGKSKVSEAKVDVAVKETEKDVKKAEHQRLAPSSSYWYDASYSPPVPDQYHYHYQQPYTHQYLQQYHMIPAPDMYDHGAANQGYDMYPSQAYQYPQHGPFSDENPNACSLM